MKINDINIKQALAHENDYRKELRSYYNSLLNGRLLSIDVENLTDEVLLTRVIDYDPKQAPINNFCTWVSIGDVGTGEYNGYDFQFIHFVSKGRALFDINFSQFKYEMSMNKKNEIAFPIFDASKAFYFCKIDDHAISPESFFSEHKGEKLLLIYSFPAVTSYNKNKTCYLFAHERISPSDIRKHIKYAQYHTIQDILDYPTLYIPGTTIKGEFENTPNVCPIYLNLCRNDITDQFANTLFNEEFRTRFESLLSKFSI